MNREPMVIAAAQKVIDAWEVWCDALGWDNLEYDSLAVALAALQVELKAEGVWHGEAEP